MLEMSGEVLQPVCGIYEIKNTETGQCYIGKSIQIPSRWANHFTELGTGRHSLILLQRDWDYYGPDAFKASVVKVVEDKAILQAEEDAVALERLDAGTKLYNAAIAGWVNEEERAARLARKRVAAAKRKRVLQRKRESQNETRNKKRGNSGNEGPVRRERGLQGRGRLPGDSTSTSVESDKRGLRKPQAGLFPSKQGADSAPGTEGPKAQGVDENGQYRERDSYDSEALPDFDDRAKQRLIEWAKEDNEPYCHLEHLCAIIWKFPPEQLAYGIRAFLSEEDVKTVHDIVDPNVVNIWFKEDEKKDFDAWLEREGVDSFQELIDRAIAQESER